MNISTLVKLDASGSQIKTFGNNTLRALESLKLNNNGLTTFTNNNL